MIKEKITALVNFHFLVKNIELFDRIFFSCLISFSLDIKSSVLADCATYSVCFASKETPVYLSSVLQVHPPVVLHCCQSFYFRDRVSRAYAKENTI